MLINLLNTLFGNLFGIYFPDIESIFADLMNIEHWWVILRPDILITLMFIITISYIFLYIMFILPFRWFKRIARVPNKKGERK